MINNGRSRKLPFDPPKRRPSQPPTPTRRAIDRAGPLRCASTRRRRPSSRCSNRHPLPAVARQGRRHLHARVRALLRRRSAPQHPPDTPDEILRSAGVLENKVRALKDLAARTLDGTVPPTPPSARADAEIVERLTSGPPASAPGPWKCSSSSAWAAPMCFRNRLRCPQRIRAHLPAPAEDAPLAAEDLPARSPSQKGNAGRHSVLSPVGISGAPATWPGNTGARRAGRASMIESSF